jgi:hypothetical protein
MLEYTLNELHLQYVKGLLNREELEAFIYNYYFYNQEKTCICHWKREEYEDYVSWFYPRLKKSIDAYQDVGSTFEAYMGKFISLSSKEYRTRLTSKSITEYYAWSAMVPELYAHEEPPSYLNDNVEDKITRLITEQNGRKNTKRILALLLKCYYYVSDDFIEKIAPKIGIDSRQLRQLIKKMQKIRQKKDDSIYHMKERIYCQYYRCFIYEKRLSLLQKNTIAYSKMKTRLEKAKERLEKMRKRILVIRTDATNKQVAQVIGVKKGTVDASLHRLKLKWNIMSEKRLLN